MKCIFLIYHPKIISCQKYPLESFPIMPKLSYVSRLLCSYISFSLFQSFSLYLYIINLITSKHRFSSLEYLSVSLSIMTAGICCFAFSPALHRLGLPSCLVPAGHAMNECINECHLACEGNKKEHVFLHSDNSECNSYFHYFYETSES